ncbi:hypothetical protein Tco_1091782 [Tanacetum coccineum]|uniref:Uncharacterized protein n=1 Tax=Tanacetum coccineum TaxID=301880 RepID=A0ABQ5I803_9ASTR
MVSFFLVVSSLQQESLMDLLWDPPLSLRLMGRPQGGTRLFQWGLMWWGVQRRPSAAPQPEIPHRSTGKELGQYIRRMVILEIGPSAPGYLRQIGPHMAGISNVYRNL